MKRIALSNVVDLFVYEYELGQGATKREAARAATVPTSSLRAYEGVETLSRQRRLDLRITPGGGRVR